MVEYHKNSYKNNKRNWIKLALQDIKYLSQTIIVLVIKTEEHATGINR